MLFLIGNGLGIRIVGGKGVPGSNGDIGAYVAKVLPGGAAEHTGKIVEGERLSQNLSFSGFTGFARAQRCINSLTR